MDVAKQGQWIGRESKDVLQNKKKGFKGMWKVTDLASISTNSVPASIYDQSESDLMWKHVSRTGVRGSV